MTTTQNTPYQSSSTPTTIGAVIVTYNRLEKLKQTVNVTLTSPFDQILIVDNASSDGTEQWLATLNDSRLTIIRAPQNLGGAGGFHLGFKTLHQLKQVDWLVCYDDDAYPVNDCIAQFKQMVLPPDAAALAGAVLRLNGQPNALNRPGMMQDFKFSQLVAKWITRPVRRWWKSPVWRRHKFFDEYYAQQTLIPIGVSTFVGFFMRTDLIEQIGLPDPKLFIYYDDTLYTWKIKQAGYGFYFCPNLMFIHEAERNKTDGVVLFNPLWRAYYNYRNRIIFYHQTTPLRWLRVRVLLNAFRWKSHAKHYPQPDLFKRVIELAVQDGLALNVSDEHSTVIARIESLAKQSGK